MPLSCPIETECSLPDMHQWKLSENGLTDASLSSKAIESNDSEDDSNNYSVQKVEKLELERTPKGSRIDGLIRTAVRFEVSQHDH